MARFDNGVRFYTTGTALIRFPEDDIACKWCPLYGVEMASNRRYCRLTGELLPSADTVGYDCPIHFEPEEEETWNPLSSE